MSLKVCSYRDAKQAARGVVCRTTRKLSLRVLLRPLRQCRVLLLLRELEMLLAEESEPRALRLVLAAWVAASHVALDPGSGSPAGNRAIAPRGGESGHDSLREQLREAVYEHIKRVRRAFGHFVFMPKQNNARNYGSGCGLVATVVDVVAPE
jgi:hypothetical protein